MKSGEKAVSVSVVIAAVIAIIAVVGAAAYVALTPPKVVEVTKVETKVEEIVRTVEVIKTVPVERIKVAVLLPGTITDSGWNQAMYLGAVRAAQELGFELRTVESLGYAAAPVEARLREFAEQGYEIIFAWTFGYQDMVIKIAPNYPDTIFIGPAFAPEKIKDYKNIISVWGSGYRAHYLSGIVAGAITKTNTIGFLGGVQIPSDIASMNAFILGAREVNPDVKLKYVFTGEWGDITKGRESALALIDAGVDVLATRGEGQALGGIQAAALRKVWVFGDTLDQNNLAKDVVVLSNIWDLKKVVSEIIKLYSEGKLLEAATDKDSPYYLADHTLTFRGSEIPLPNPLLYEKVVPEDVRKMVDDLRKKIEAREFEPPFITEIRQDLYG